MADVDIGTKTDKATVSDTPRVQTDRNLTRSAPDTTTVTDTPSVRLNKLLVRSGPDVSTVSDTHSIWMDGVAFGDCVLPSVEIYQANGYGSFVGDIEFSNLRLDADLITGQIGTAVLEFKPLEIEADNTGLGVVGLSLPIISLTSTGYTGSVGTLEHDLYSYLRVTGTLLHTDDLTSSTITLPLLSVAGTGVHGSYATSALSIRLQLSAAGYTGSVGTLAEELPILTMVAASGGSYIGQANLVLPIFTVDNSQIGVINVGTFSVYAMNTNNFGVSSFSNYNFNSFANFNGSYIAASSSGLFLLHGSTDYSNNKINIELSKQDIIGDNRNKKRIKNIYTELETDGRFEIDVEASDRTYSYLNQPVYDQDDGIQTIRMKVGKGLVGKFFTLKLRNKSGSYIKLRKVDLDIDMLERSGDL